MSATLEPPGARDGRTFEVPVVVDEGDVLALLLPLDARVVLPLRVELTRQLGIWEGDDCWISLVYSFRVFTTGTCLGDYNYD